MSVTWTLTDAELVVAWQKLFTDTLPSPLCATLGVQYADEYLRLVAQTWQSILDRYDGALHHALGQVAAADVRVVAQAVDPSDPENAAARVRIVGAQQGSTAVLIRQLPGESMWHSGGFVITRGHCDRLAAAVAGALPPREPGRLPDIPLVPAPDDSDTDHWYGQSEVFDEYPQLQQRATDWLDSPVDVLGSIETSQGSSVFGPRGIHTRRIYWRDLTGNGRYAVADTAHPVAASVDRRRLAAMIAADIAATLPTVEDERNV